MKELYFAADLLTLFRDDKYYSVPKNSAVTLRKLGLSSIDQSDRIERLLHELVVHIMDQYGESEPFLAGTFIYPEAVIAFFREHGLPVPAAMRPVGTTNNGKEVTAQEEFEQYFDIVCRNCGTVMDPLAKSYRSPIGRLIFRTFLETRRNLGINTTAKYILEHLTEFDSDKIVISANENSVTWLSAEAKEQTTSAETIAQFILNFNRVTATLL